MTLTATRRVFPVIHHLHRDCSLYEAELAFENGADGVFLISHHGRDTDLFEPAQTLKARYPHKLVGLNLLSATALSGLDTCASLGLDMAWADSAGVDSRGVSSEGLALAERLRTLSLPPAVFASVAFKYQAQEQNPAQAGRLAHSQGFLPTTSGDATGYAPSVDKLQRMAEALSPTARLAVASGMTPENVASYLPFVTDFLVATGVSLDTYHFDPKRLRRFIDTVHHYEGTLA